MAHRGRTGGVSEWRCARRSSSESTGAHFDDPSFSPHLLSNFWFLQQIEQFAAAASIGGRTCRQSEAGRQSESHRLECVCVGRRRAVPDARAHFPRPLTRDGHGVVGLARHRDGSAHTDSTNTERSDRRLSVGLTRVSTVQTRNTTERAQRHQRARGRTHSC